MMDALEKMPNMTMTTNTRPRRITAALRNVSLLLLLCESPQQHFANAFSPPATTLVSTVSRSSRTQRICSSSSLNMASSTTTAAAASTTTKTSSIVLPSESSIVGTVGSGYLPILLAKLASHRGHGKSWILCPDADANVMNQLLEEQSTTLLPENLEIVLASNTPRIKELLSQSNALFIATDDVERVMDPNVINYLLDPTMVNNNNNSNNNGDTNNNDGKINMKRIVAMSRNLNGSGMGFFVSASKRAANAQVWDNSNAEALAAYETNIKEACSQIGADWTIVRAGTLKGGASGDRTAATTSSTDADAANNYYYPQYLPGEIYYDMTKSDIISWQFLFDVNVRGVKLQKGDVLPGPGMKAVFAAIGSDGSYDGDTSRAGIAEAMVRSLEMDVTANVDFGVGTDKSRRVPSEEEWMAMFQQCFSSV